MDGFSGECIVLEIILEESAGYGLRDNVIGALFSPGTRGLKDHLPISQLGYEINYSHVSII